MTDFMPSQEQRGEPTVTSLKAELATAREDYARACHALVEAHGMLKDARAELAALKERLAGLRMYILNKQSSRPMMCEVGYAMPEDGKIYVSLDELKEALK